MGKKISSKGFTLIELAISISVLGLIIYTALAIFAERSAIDKVAVTNKKLEVIEDALRHYYLYSSPQSLPCPADGTLALDNANYGKVDCTITAVSAVLRGVVPVRSLNLPDSYMFDAWGRRITYVVSRVHTPAALNWATTPAIKIRDIANTAVSNTAVYIVISHGKNGIGAWNRNGGTTRVARTGSTSNVEQENASVNTSGGNETTGSYQPNDIFVDALYDDTEDGITPNAEYFDDLVRWKIKEMVDYDADRLP